MSCLDCGDKEQNPNPLNSCDRLACDNPCGAGPSNTPQCETLPSQIQNFTDAFFGEIVKTEQNGKVVWSLPCSLDVGLPDNPRGTGEGLACYFLRLFMDGITGLKGDKGDTGVATNGLNAYSVTLHSFPQPSLAAPSAQVTIQFNPAVGLPGSHVFIDTSGWYQVVSLDNNNILTLTLIKALAGAPGTIVAGKLVVVTGPPGASITGQQGIQGPKGDKGDPGSEPTATNGMYTPGVTGVDPSLDVTYAVTDYTTSKMQFLAVTDGTYLVNVAITAKALPGVLTSDGIFIKLVNDSLSADIDGTEQVVTGMVVNDHVFIGLTAIVTIVSPGQTISVYSKCSVAGHGTLQAARSVLTWVKLS